MEIKANKENNTVLINDDGTKKEINIKNLNGWNRHSFPRMVMIDINSGEVLASLSGGGSYGWIIHCKDMKRRSLLLKVAKAAQKADLYWPWTNVQC